MKNFKEKIHHPIISILIPTFNEEDVLGKCLDSIFGQDYPLDKLEVFIVDNYSTDKTLEVAKKYPVKILMNEIKDAQVGKRIAFDVAKGEFYSWIDADMELADKQWIKRMLYPLQDDITIVASLCTFRIKGTESPLTKFLTIDSLSSLGYSSQADPIYQFFAPPVTDTIIEWKDGYGVCIYDLGKVPSMGVGLYRRKEVEKTVHLQGNKLMELDIFVHLINLGQKRFAYVPVGIYHDFMPDLKTLVRKRWRHISRNYLGQTFKRVYTWFDLYKPKDFLKVIFWIIYVHLFIPELVRGIYKSLIYKTWVGLYQPVVSLLETDAILYGFAYYYFKLKFK